MQFLSLPLAAADTNIAQKPEIPAACLAECPLLEKPAASPAPTPGINKVDATWFDLTDPEKVSANL